MADVQIRFQVRDLPTRDLQRLRGEVNRLQREFGATNQASTRAAQAVQQVGQTSRTASQGVDRLGDEAQQAAIGIDTLGRNIFRTSAEAKRFGGIFQDVSGRLREANGRYTAASVGVRELGAGMGVASRGAEGLTRSFGTATGGAQVFTRSLNGLTGVLGAIGIAAVTHQVTQFGVESVQAAGRLEQYYRATEQITGSAAAAEQRISELIEVANLPGLNFEALVRFSNRLSAAGVVAEDIDTILLGTGQTIVSLGGTAATAELAVEQLVQAFQQGTVDMRDFRTIIQQIPGFLEAAGDVHGVEASIQGLREAFNNVGGSMRDLVIPVFDELSRRFEAPPTDSYIVAMDTLQNAFFLTQAAIGDQFLPIIVDAAQGLADFFEAIRAGVEDVTTLPEPIQELIAGVEVFFNALRNVSESIGSVIAPPIQELASQLAGLLGAVLELAGALYNSLEPVFRGVYVVIGTVVTAVAQLVDHITFLIDGLTAAVNWVSQFWTEEERAVVSTDKLTEAQRNLQAVTEGASQAMQSASEGTKAAAVSTEEFASRINELLPALNSVNAQLEAKRARYKELIDQGANPAAAAMEQLERQITTLETRSANLTGQVDRLKQGFQTLESPINEDEVALRSFISSVDEFGGALSRIDTRFLSFHERTAAYTGAIRELPPAIRAVRDEFDVLAPTAARINAIFEDFNPTLVDTQTEIETLDQVTQGYIQTLQDLEGLAHVNAVVDRRTDPRNANLVNPEISQTVDVLRDYGQALTHIQGEYQELDQIVDRNIQTIRRSAEGFEELRTNVDSAALSFDVFDDFDAQVQAVPGDVDFLTGTIDTLSEHTELFGDIAVTAFGEAAFAMSQTAEEIDTVGESLLSVSDILARTALGDPTAIAEAPFRVSQIIEQQDAAFAQRRQARREVAIDDRTLRGTRLDNLSRVAQALNIPAPRFEDLSLAPHTVQGLQTPFDFQASDVLGDVGAIFETGDFNLRGGIGAALQRVIEEADIEGVGEEIISQIAQLAVGLGRTIEGADIEAIFEPFIESLGRTMERVGGDFEDAIESGAATSVVTESFNTYLGSINDYFDLQIQAVRTQERATGVFLTETIQAIETARASTLNAARQLDTGTNLTAFGADRRIQDARALAERTGTDRQAIEDVARAQYGDEAYDAEVAAAAPETVDDDALAAVIEGINADVQLINASITGIETQIDQASDPEEIAQLLNQLPALIAEKYQNLRQALDERFAAGDITQDVYDASISELESSESAELEAQSDAVLANTLRAINEDVQLIDASIASIQTQIDQLSEPEAIAELLGQIPALITEKYRGLREALDAKYAAGEISTDVYNASLTQLATSESADIERQSDAVLANALSEIDDDVALIDAEIGALQLAVSQSDDPEAVAGLLDAIRILIADKYKQLRERLEELHAAEEISDTAFNAAFLALGPAESQALADIDTQVINEVASEARARADFINGAVENLRTSLQLTDDPDQIQAILETIKTLTSARFQALRDELEAIRDTLSPEKYTQALEGLNLGEQLALENLDTEKFDAISAAAAEQVEFINGSIENLRLAIQLTDDPTEQQAILDSIKVLVMARFEVLREELEKVRDRLDDGEYEQALEGLNLGEQLALQNLDTEKFELISQEAQKQVGLINGAIENLRLSLQVTEDPAAQQQILDAIKILTAKRFDILIQELKDIEENLESEEFQQALEGLELGKQLALEAIDTEKFESISAAAQEQVNRINGQIENLRLSLQLTDDVTEQQQILESIKILTRARFAVLRKELEDIKANLSQEEYEQALTGLNLSEQLALENLDTEKFGVISEAAQKQVAFINTSIENLRLSLELTSDPAEVQSILDAIKTLTRGRFQVLRDELEAIRSTLTDEEYQQALTGLNLGEQVALKNLDSQKFSAISDAAQQQVQFIEGAIDNLRLSLELTVDDTEIQQILDAIKILVGARFDVLIDELRAIRDTLTPAQFQQALTGLQLGRDVALRGIDNEALSNTINAINTDTQAIDNQITALNSQIENSNDPAEIQQLLVDLQAAITEKYRLQREVLQKQLDAEEISIDVFNTQLGAINLQETQALGQVESFAFGQLNDIRTTENALIRNAIERSQFNLNRATSQSDFEARQQELLTLTNQYYDAELARINELQLSELELQDLREDNQLSRVQALERILGLTYDQIDAETRAAEIRDRSDLQRADVRRDARARREDLEIGTRRSLEDFFRETGGQGINLDQFGLGADQAIRRLIEGAGSYLSPEQVVQEIFGTASGDRNFRFEGFIGDENVDRFVRGELEDFVRQLQRDQEDIRREEARRLEDIAIQEQRQLTEQGLIDSNVTLTEAIVGLTGAITQTVPETLTDPEPQTQPESVTESTIPVNLVTSQPTAETPTTDPFIETTAPDLTALTALGVVASQFSEDAALLRTGADHLFYAAEEVVDFTEMMGGMPSTVGNAKASVDKFVDTITQGTKEIDDASNTAGSALANIATALQSIQSNGGLGGGNYRFLLEFPNGVIHEIGNTLIEDTTHGTFPGFGDS